jgi:hypothetical protein
LVRHACIRGFVQAGSSRIVGKPAGGRNTREPPEVDLRGLHSRRLSCGYRCTTREPIQVVFGVLLSSRRASFRKRLLRRLMRGADEVVERARVVVVSVIFFSGMAGRRRTEASPRGAFQTRHDGLAYHPAGLRMAGSGEAPC